MATFIESEEVFLSYLLIDLKKVKIKDYCNKIWSLDWLVVVAWL